MSSASPARAERVALTVVQLGAVAVVMAALPFKAFELDRFFVPKELALHATAGTAAALCVARAVGASRGAGGARRAPTDWALVAFLALGAVSAALATNWWLAARALAISLSGVALFWTSRALARAGHGRAIVVALAAAVTLAAATSLAQAYGVESDYFSINRAPGGTFGNRNFIAHLSAIGLPIVLLCALTAARPPGALLAALASAALAGTLFLSRSRAAWLGLAAAAIPLALAWWRSRRLADDARLRGRRRLAGVAMAAGVAAAFLLPNTLQWKSDTPYLDTMRDVVEYKEGSGHGRLVQYENSLRMAIDHPALGVGPGNWPVWYPRYASRHDPSLTDEGMTANPWPSSDWAAFVSERGFAAAALLAFALLGVGVRALVAILTARTTEELVAPAALASSLLAAVVVGAFDAALLLAAPALVVWCALGALWPDRAGQGGGGGGRRGRGARAAGGGAGRPRVAGALALVTLLLVVRSASQAAAMALVGDDPTRSALERAALADPGSYRIQLWLARGDARHGRCRDVRSHAGRANALFPSAPEPRRLLARCGVTVSAPPRLAAARASGR